MKLIVCIASPFVMEAETHGEAMVLRWFGAGSAIVAHTPHTMSQTRTWQHPCGASDRWVTLRTSALILPQVDEGHMMEWFSNIV